MLVLDRRRLRSVGRPRHLLDRGPHPIEALLELVLRLLFEMLLQLAFEIAVTFGWESLRDTFGRSRRSAGALSGLGLVLMGAVTGYVSVLVLGRRLTPRIGLPGVSLVLAPLGTGLIMSWVGRRWRRRGNTPPPLLTFAGGATFAGAMAAVRFLMIERGWWRRWV